jgi:glycosyltransferase involved in cell wall biosynthesis
MAVLESMSVGVPVVATACGSLPELLADGRGFPMDTEYSMLDPWGNSRRDFPDAENGAFILEFLFKNGASNSASIGKARAYMETRTWDKPIQQLVNAMEKLEDVTKE